MDLFSKEPLEILDGDYHYGTDDVGDQFDEHDEARWLSSRFKENIDVSKEPWLFSWFPMSQEICQKIADEGKPFLEIACGPGMGLTPFIRNKNPEIVCLATDASSRLIKAWRKYINSQISDSKINLASFNALDMPLKDHSFDYVTSYIGISNTRDGVEGKLQALKEVYRVLKPGGYFVGVEADFEDYSKIDEVFKLAGRENYYVKPELSWAEKIAATDFEIVSDDQHYIRNFTSDDNELGAYADQFGIEIGLKNTLYILRKK